MLQAGNYDTVTSILVSKHTMQLQTLDSLNNFGVVVHGLDIASGVQPDTLRALLDLLMEHRFIVLPGQSLNHDQYVAFGRCWGDPVKLISSDNRLDSHPEMIPQSNSCAVPVFFRSVANHWHCDSSYEERVATFTMLYGVETPDEGGETLFADLVAAYEALNPETRMTLQNYQVNHRTAAAKPLPDEFISDLSQMPPELRANASIPEPVTHPLVQQHPVNGRTALYGLGGSCCGIEGMSSEDSELTLLDLRRFVTQSRFVSRYKLMPGDVLIWDNFSVMHRATSIEYSDAPGCRRLNYRISLKGLPTFC